MAIEIGEGNLLRRNLKPIHVALRPKQSDLTHLIFVGLEALVALHSIVERGIERVQEQALEGFDFGRPPLPIFRNYRHHVLGWLLPECHPL